MSTSPTFIVGAGLAGLIAAHAWPSAGIVERSPAPAENHKALLRFRGEAVSQLTGIEFRPVRVHKGIWFNARFHNPDIRLANWYTRKVARRMTNDRSIWNVEAADRWVAPPDLYEQLLANVGPRINWGVEFGIGDMYTRRPVVSTIPLNVSVRLLPDPPELTFSRASITVRRYALPKGTDLYQTIYFPDPNYALYRASITHDLLIMEFAGTPGSEGEQRVQMEDATMAFGLGSDMELLSETSQMYGKIAPIEDDAARKQALFRLSHEFGVYSLGRFATWRNILLDDVVHDIAMIKRLLRLDGGAYDIHNGSAA